MDNKTHSNHTPYVPLPRKPVPNPNNTHQIEPQQASVQGSSHHVEYQDNQQGSAPLPGTLPPQTYTPPAGKHYAGSHPCAPEGTQYQYYNQNHAQYTPYLPPSALGGPQDQNRYATHQNPQSPNVRTTLKSFGSFMKTALKATLDPNNMYGGAMTGQQFGFGQSQGVPGQNQSFQQTQSYGNVPVCQQTQSNGGTVINGQVIDAAASSRLQMSGITPMPGRYWYDNRCGAWGLESGPCIGILPANLSLGGALLPNASGPSTTGVFINGRQIHAMDAAQFQSMGITCIPGRWWVNADGTYGMEGNMIPWGNLKMAAMASNRGKSGYGSWSNGDSFGGSDGQGFNYVGGHDSTGRMWSVTTDGSGYFSS